MGEEKVERTQAKNRADVGSIDDELILSDREHRRDRVNGKDKVHQIDHNQNERQRSEHPAPVDIRFEVLVMEIPRDRDHFSNRPHPPGVAEALFARFSEEHSDRGENEENAEQVEDEVEAGDKGYTQPNHNASHNESPDDSPYQHAMLRFPRDLKMGED